MSHIDEVKILRKRAKSFLLRAIECLNSKDYDLASFLSEQAVQLYLKSILLEEIGDYPRTRSISVLISILKKLTNYNLLLKFLEEKRNEIRFMEDAYIASRYLVREYTESAKTLVDIAKEVLKYGKIY